MTDELQRDTTYDVLLLKFVVSAIIDRSRDRGAILDYIRINLDTFSAIVGSGKDGEFYKGRIRELLEFLESGDKKPTFTGSPPQLRLVRSREPNDPDRV